MTVTPRQLLRLFPRFWRRRYADEFLALLEDTRITRAVIIDVARAAAHEWMTGTLTMRVVLGMAVSGAATACAVALTRLVSVSPTIWIEAGQTIVAPPWPVSLGFLGPMVVMAGAVRFLSALIRPGRPILSFPFGIWLAALFLAQIASQWGDLVLWLGTGIKTDSLFEIWQKGALQVTTCLLQLFLADTLGNPRFAPPPRKTIAPPENPLGLGTDGSPS
jgi:hypothetical protein